MLETNIKIVNPGLNLYIEVRKADLLGSGLTPEIVEKACRLLLFRHGLSAVPYKLGETPSILVATTEPIAHVRLAADSWDIEVVDSEEWAWKLSITDSEGAKLVPILVERALLAKIIKGKKLWSIDSPNIWYEPEPFHIDAGIAAYRRYEFATEIIEEKGVGISVDVGTAFFTEHSLAYYFDTTISKFEQQQRRERFGELTQRQARQKGTLLYDNGSTQRKCYFVAAPPDITCATTKTFRIDGQIYLSLADYYRIKYPNLIFKEEGRAIQVSFIGLGNPVWVAAERVRIRVGNEDLPRSMQNDDKIEPALRRELIQKFWNTLGIDPLGKIAPGVSSGFWQPGPNYVQRLSMPDLLFGNDHTLTAPQTKGVYEYKDNYRQRARQLEQFGCYNVPLAMPRTLYFACPQEVDEQACNQLATDLCKAVTKWTECHIGFKLVTYTSVQEAIDKLRKIEHDQVGVFILDHDPATYYDVAFHLGKWRIKRLTQHTLGEFYDYLKKGAWNKATRSKDLERGSKRWNDLIEKNALELLQLMDVIPFRINQAGPYEAQLVIDVGHDSRYYALSLLIVRNKNKSPDFSIVSRSDIKADHQAESINPIILRDQIVSLIENALRNKSEPLSSLLVLRDGKLCGQETKGIDEAINILVKNDKLCQNPQVHLAELRKRSLKSVRFWEVKKINLELIVENPLEGTMVRLNQKTVAVASTGAATVHQGTADPFLIVANGRCPDIIGVAQAAFNAAQLNWSSPSVAQRLPLSIKRTDEVLETRANQEVRRLT